MATPHKMTFNLDSGDYVELNPVSFDKQGKVDLGPDGDVDCEECGDSLRRASALQEWAFGPRQVKCRCGKKYNVIARDAAGEQV